MAGGFLFHGFFPLPARADYDGVWSHTRTPLVSVTTADQSLWQYNQTCVNVATGSQGLPQANFTFTTGSMGNGRNGSNCNSADIILSKAPVSLSSVSARELEILQSWVAKVAGIPALKIFFFLRNTNGTLPSFTEGWDPEGDPNVRLLWTICLSSNPACVTPFQSVFIPHDIQKTIAQEGESSDVIVSKTGIDNFGGITNIGDFAVILNFTGPRNFLHYADATNYNATSNIQSQFDLTRSYYFGAQVTWRQDVTPASNDVYTWEFNRLIAGSANGKTFSINTLPAACSDQINFGQGGCANPNVVPQFNINPLDPSTWLNAIIQGLAWAAGQAFQAIAPIFSLIFNAFKLALDTMGNFLGVGPLGSNIAAALSNFAVWITSIFGTAFTQVVNATNFVVSSLSVVTNVIGTYWGQLASFLADLSAFMAGLWTVLGQFLQYGSIALKYGVVLWWVMGMSMAYRRIDLFMMWTRLSYMFILYPFKWADWLFENVIRKIIIRFKDIVFRWV